MNSREEGSMQAILFVWGRGRDVIIHPSGYSKTGPGGRDWFPQISLVLEF